MDDTSSILTLEIKTSKVSKILSISSTASVADLKLEVAKAFEASSDRLCLICQGKIMKDIEILSSYNNLKKNSTIYLVIKGEPKSKIVKPTAGAASSSSSANVPQESKPSNSNENQPSNTQGFAFPKFSENDFSMASQLMKNLPPQYLEMIVKQNPMTKKLLEENPELRSQLTGSNIKKMAEMLSNPTMAAELMRNQENMMQQIQNIPGAASHLERMMNSMSESPMENPYAYDPSYRSSSARTDDQVRPNLSGEPIPNPWASSQNPNRQSNDNNTGVSSTLGGDFREISRWMANMSNNGDENNFGDAEQLERAFQEALFASSSNRPQNSTETSQQQNIPENISQAVASIDPSVISDLLNPKIANAFKTITDNIELIKKEAPQLLPALYRMFEMKNPSFVGNLGALANNSPLNMDLFGSTSQTAGAKGLPPKERFKNQLQDLKDMGFVDEDLNIRALEVCDGNVTLAIEWLIRNNFI